jgi:hypothetical protein
MGYSGQEFTDFTSMGVFLLDIRKKFPLGCFATSYVFINVDDDWRSNIMETGL